jgi:hypothetical protein
LKVASVRSRRGIRTPEIISYCVWLYFRFSVTYRDIEELMAERAVTVKTRENYSPRLADKVGLASDLGVVEISRRLANAVKAVA